MSEYSIENAFSEIEQELINSMLRNYKRHKMWEKEEGFNWTMWQAEQLKSLQKYRLANKDKFKTRFTDINDEIDEMLRKAYMAGGMSQETKILKAIKRGYIPNNIPERINEFISNNKGKSLKEIASDLIARFKGEKVVGFNAEFFKINDRKLNELIKATKNDFEKAEIAMLRRSNDIYRKTIYNSQVYFNTGAGTYEKAVDMATKDFLAKGIDCIEYKNGARVNICDYVSMYLQTANKRAYLQGEGAKRQEWGIHTVIIVNRGGGCPKCTPFQGRAFIDDVWSGGSAKDGDYPLLSSAIAAGLYHPRCKDSHTTYFPGISSEPKPPSKEEQKKSIEIYNLQQKQKYTERMIRKYGNLESSSLDEENRKKYKYKKVEWKKVENNYGNDIININKLGNSNKNGYGGTGKGEFIEKIDSSQIENKLKEYEEEIRDLKKEYSVVIDKYNNVYCFEGEKDNVIMDIDLDNAIITHNHPYCDDGYVSFGADDYYFLKNNPDIKILRAVNNKYEYQVSLLKELTVTYNEYYKKGLDIMFSNGDINGDVQHYVFEALRKDGYIEYKRMEFK